MNVCYTLITFIVFRTFSSLVLIYSSNAMFKSINNDSEIDMYNHGRFLLSHLTCEFELDNYL